MKNLIGVVVFCLLSCNMLHAQNVTQVEYFIDSSDPGFGLGTQVPVTPATSITESFLVDISGVSTGLHTLNVRVKSVNGPNVYWSLTNTKSFYSITAITPNITQIEYYVDTDPGFGLAQQVSITQGLTVNTSFLVNTSALATGIHSLKVRAKDANGLWSLTHSVPFYVVSNVASNINRVEYFFDNTDPGFGNATAVAITPGANVTQSFVINTSGLAVGLHRLNIRSRDSDGQWSLTHTVSFINVSTTLPNIERIEYFFDTDPGFGAGTSVSISPNTNLTSSFVADLSGLSGGIHFFHMRAKDAAGHWSLTKTQPIIVVKQVPDVVAVEYAVDTDPGVGNGTLVMLVNPAANVNETVAVALGGLTEGSHKVYIRPKDSNGVWGTTDILTFTVCEVLPPVATASGITTNKFLLKWNAVAGATSYKLDISTDNFTTFITGYNNKSLTDTTQLVINLSPDVTYQYRLRTQGHCLSVNSATLLARTYQETDPADSTALVQLYNATGGVNWNVATNWLITPVAAWSGVIVTLGNVTSLDLSGNTLSGAIPSGITTLSSLENANFSNNALSGLPNMSSITSLTTLDVSNNRLTFEDLESNISISGISYTPQATVGAGDTLFLAEGDPLELNVTVGGTVNNYQWQLDGVAVSGETSNTVSRTSTVDDDGVWELKITNSIVTGLNLYSTAVKVIVQASGNTADSLALVALYNSTGGPNWIDNSNWLTGSLDTWHGIIVTDDHVTSIDLSDNNLQGAADDALATLYNLNSIDLSGNGLTSLPNLTILPALTSLDVSSNNLDFASLEANISLINFSYTDQVFGGEADTVLVQAKVVYEFSVEAGGINNVYQWKRNGTNIEGANANVYTIASVTRNSKGTYACEITNSVVEGLTLTSAAITIFPVADISGKLYAAPDEFATQGLMTLFKITDTNGYDTTAIVQITEGGNYIFEDVILDDYQVMGFADKTEYPFTLPTYYSSTIYWEEADTLFVDSMLTNIDIVAQLEPLDEPNGAGAITGYVIEDDGLGGRIKKSKRVGGAGVSVRKVERTGRGKEEILTLIAYTLSDEEGEFVFENLPQDQYRINVQYPGYPMDVTSALDITVGQGLQAEKRVEASVEGGNIKVRELIITGLWSQESYPAEIYPNPSRGIVRIKFARSSDERLVQVYDLTGRDLIRQQANEKELLLDISDLAAGFYLVDVENKGIKVKTLRLEIH